MTLCSCGSGRPLQECCMPFIDGQACPPTAEALMRARYTAHSQGRYEYLRASTHPDALAGINWEELEKWSSSVSWDGLEILATEGGAEADKQGVVSFLARFTYEGIAQDHRERSLFQRDAQGNWVYVDGELEKQEPVRRDAPKIGRNDPCLCGSGKKYKKCCGA